MIDRSRLIIKPAVGLIAAYFLNLLAVKQSVLIKGILVIMICQSFSDILKLFLISCQRKMLECLGIFAHSRSHVIFNERIKISPCPLMRKRNSLCHAFEQAPSLPDPQQSLDNRGHIEINFLVFRVPAHLDERVILQCAQVLNQVFRRFNLFFLFIRRETKFFEKT